MDGGNSACKERVSQLTAAGCPIAGVKSIVKDAQHHLRKLKRPGFRRASASFEGSSLSGMHRLPVRVADTLSNQTFRFNRLEGLKLVALQIGFRAIEKDNAPGSRGDISGVRHHKPARRSPCGRKDT